MNAPHVVCGAFSCLSTAALEAIGGGATKVGPCLLVLRLLLLRLSDVLYPLVLRVWRACGSSAGSFSFGASLPSVHELSQTLPNGAVDNRC